MKQAFVEWVGDEPFPVSWQLLEAQCDLTHPLTRDRCSQVKWFSDKDSCLLSSGSIKSCWTEQAAHLHPLPLAASLQPEVRSSSLQRVPPALGLCSAQSTTLLRKASSACSFCLLLCPCSWLLLACWVSCWSVAWEWPCLSPFLPRSL